MRAVVVVLISLLHGGCIAGNGGVAVFPAKYEVAPTTSAAGGATDSGMHYAAGLSSASWSDAPDPPVDVVVGYEVDHFAERSKMTRGDEAYVVHGLFAEVATRVLGDARQRVWLGVKGEVLFDDRTGRDGAELGAATRVAWELFRGVKHSSRNAGVEGTLAVGLFAEAGLRTGPDDERAVVALGGLSLRVPLAGAR